MVQRQGTTQTGQLYAVYTVSEIQLPTTTTTVIMIIIIIISNTPSQLLTFYLQFLMSAALNWWAKIINSKLQHCSGTRYFAGPWLCGLIDGLCPI